MSWRNILAAAAGLALLSVSACGFKPVYDTSPAADAGNAMEQLHHVVVAPVPDRVGVRLRSELQRLFSPAAEPPTHTLHIALETRSRVMAIEEDASVRRSILYLVAEVRLVPSGGAVSMPEFKTTVRSNAGAEQLPSDFATLVSEGAAEQRAVEELAQRIRQQLALHFARTG
jgi:hypothetical protein